MIATNKVSELSMGNTSLRTAIRRMSNPSKEEVKRLYGDIGVDIFEGKNKITILTDKSGKKSQPLYDKIINWLRGDKKFDYEEKDSIRDLVHKYAYNNVSGTYEEIEEKFGQEGLKAANIFKAIRYFKGF